MKSLLKNVGAKVLVGSIIGVHVLVPAGIMAGVGTLVAQRASQGKLDTYYDSPVVQELVSDELLGEQSALTERLKSGEIGEVEFDVINMHITSEAHKQEVTQNIANEVYVGDEKFNEAKTQADQLTTAYLASFSTALGATFCCVAGYAGLFEKMLEVAEKSSDDAYDLKDEEKHRKKEKQLEKEQMRREKEMLKEIAAYDEELEVS